MFKKRLPAPLGDDVIVIEADKKSKNFNLLRFVLQ